MLCSVPPLVTIPDIHVSALYETCRPHEDIPQEADDPLYLIRDIPQKVNIVDQCGGAAWIILIISDTRLRNSKEC